MPREQQTSALQALQLLRMLTQEERRLSYYCEDTVRLPAYIGRAGKTPSLSEQATLKTRQVIIRAAIDNLLIILEDLITR